MIGDGGLAPSGSRVVFINASGWLASLSHRQPTTLPSPADHNCLGSVAAACLGVAQMFKVAVEASAERSFREGIFDLFHLNWAETRTPPYSLGLPT